MSERSRFNLLIHGAAERKSLKGRGSSCRLTVQFAEVVCSTIYFFANQEELFLKLILLHIM